MLSNLVKGQLGGNLAKLTRKFGSAGPYNPMRYKSYLAPKEYPT